MTEPAASRRPLSSLSPRVRWAVPAVVAVAVVGAFAAPPLFASAEDANLPAVTPQQLVATVADAKPVPLSGTVVYTARLGLPEIPLTQLTGADPVALLGGSSTLRVWTDGVQRSRVSLLGDTSEYSSVQDGAQAWTYSSAKDQVVHYSLSASDQARFDKAAGDVRAGTVPDVAGTVPELAGGLPTPAAAAAAALAQVQTVSSVTLAAPTTVAGRSAYQLVVTPKSGATLVAKIVVAIDAKTSTPLRVQAWSVKDAKSPALEIGFTDVSFGAPDNAALAFSPPAGAKVRDVVVPLPTPTEVAGAKPADKALPAGVSISGTGWETVTQLSGVDVAGLVSGNPAALPTLPGAKPIIGSQSGQDLLGEFLPADGSGGPAAPGLDASALYNQLTTVVPEGRILTSTLLSVLVTNDGRVLAGAVPADTLRALAR